MINYLKTLQNYNIKYGKALIKRVKIWSLFVVASIVRFGLIILLGIRYR